MAVASDLVELFHEASSMVLVCHDNPDSDCLVSAVALRHIASDCGLTDITIASGGTISHQQTRTLVNVLGLDRSLTSATVPGRADLVAFIDHSGSVAHAEQTPDGPVDIVIDSHPPRDGLAAAYVDVREHYGATATILGEYLRDLAVEIPSELASAVLFAIHDECIDTVQYPTRHEYELARYLFPLVDIPLIRSIYNASFTPTTMDTMARAIEHRTVRGDTLVSNVGRLSEHSALSQAADVLLHLEGVRTVLVYGVIARDIYLSARSADPATDVAATLTRAFGTVGIVGGDWNGAAGRISLGLFGGLTDDRVVDLLSVSVPERFFAAIAADGDSY